MISRLAAMLAALALASCATAPAPPPGPALFVVSDEDSTMYLFGTVHVLKPEMEWGGANAQAALAAAEEVWTEIPMTPEVEARAQQLALQHGLAPEDRPLSSWLTAEEKARLDALWARFGVPAAAMERMRPWLAAITLTLLPLQRAGYSPQHGVDQQIDAIAEAAGKRRRALESVEEQMGFLSSFSDAAERQMLLEAIEEAEAGAGQFEALAEAWASGDLAALEAGVVGDAPQRYPEFYEVMFVRRNAAWAEILARELEGAGVDFVAVGAGHLVGDDSVIALLRSRGYQIERAR